MVAVYNQDRYIRRVKGGRYQARPYDAVDGKRYNLGIYNTREQAAAAIKLFWQGKLKELPRFVLRVKNRRGEFSHYAVRIHWLGNWFSAKQKFSTIEDAVRWRDDFVKKRTGLWANLVLNGREGYRREPD